MIQYMVFLCSLFTPCLATTFVSSECMIKLSVTYTHPLPHEALRKITARRGLLLVGPAGRPCRASVVRRRSKVSILRVGWARRFTRASKLCPRYYWRGNQAIQGKTHIISCAADVHHPPLIRLWTALCFFCMCGFPRLRCLWLAGSSCKLTASQLDGEHGYL